MKHPVLNKDKIISYKAHDTSFNLDNIMGESGALLCFSGYIWDLRCIRYALWLQQYSEQFKIRGLTSTLVLPAHKHELSGFLMSIPQSIRFSLIADPQNILLKQYEMDSSGFVLLDSSQKVLNRWYADDALYIGVRRVLEFIR